MNPQQDDAISYDSPVIARLDTVRRMALDFLACAGVGLPAALVWPGYAPYIVLAGYVVALTVVLPVEGAEEYRRYGRFTRLLGLIGVATALSVSLVLPVPARQAASALAASGFTPTAVRFVAAICIGLVALAMAQSDGERAG